MINLLDDPSDLLQNFCRITDSSVWAVEDGESVRIVSGLSGAGQFLNCVEVASLLFGVCAVPGRTMNPFPGVPDLRFESAPCEKFFIRPPRQFCNFSGNAVSFSFPGEDRRIIRRNRQEKIIFQILKK